MGEFNILMWKHYVVRKRRYIQTLVELLTPISLVLGVFLLKDAMRKKTESFSSVSSFPVSSFHMDSTEGPAGVIFTPDSIATQRLMKEVILSLNQFHSANKSVHNTRSLALPNISLAVEALLIIATISKSVYAVVEFEDMNSTELPNTLKYKIRMISLISRTPKVRFQRLFEKFEDVPQPFLPLQWSIDKSFLTLKSNSNIDQKIEFEPLAKKPAKKPLNKTYISTVFFLLNYISFGAPLLPFVFLMNRLLEERATGVQELVKMVGVTPTMLGITQYMNTLPACLIYCIGGVLLMKCSENPMVPKTCTTVLFFGQFLHFNTMIAMAFACSFISSDTQHTVSLSLFSYIGMWLPTRLLGYSSSSDLNLFWLGLCPHCPAYWIYNEAMVSEVRQETGIQLETMHQRFAVYQDGTKNASVMVAFLMQLLQITYFYVATWFLEKVRPGKYGIALPWNFMLQKSYWSHKTEDIKTVHEQSHPYDPVYEKYFEEPPSNMPIGIKVHHVSKIFGSGSSEFVALNNVTLNVYKGEITVLLGHNGAGKTTLISIITGMLNQTSGKVYVNGIDTVTQQDKIRKDIGFCPQHNLFFSDLTVKEHLMFFTLLKGGSFAKAKMAAYSIMDQLDLISYDVMKTSQLSGGLLRRLQLACALCGNASVLILDEPTSGLDVEARRELVDMLLSLRGDRTLILTTHFMEEADVLGDRMAALHLGKLRCHATPMFLKKAVGSGFHVSIKTNHEPFEEKITQVLQELLPGVNLKESFMKTLTYSLPGGAKLSSFFNKLENKEEELDIQTIGVGIATLEEVFLELCCDVITTSKSESEACATVQLKYVTGIRLLWRQVKTLYKRQIDYTISTLFSFVLLHVIMPFVLCTCLTQIFNILDFDKNLDLTLNLDMYSDVGLKDAVLNLKVNASKSAIADISYAYPLYNFKHLKEKPFAHSLSLAEVSGVPREKWENYVVGITLNDTLAQVLYTPILKHSAPVGLNLLSNIFAIEKIPTANGKTIMTKITNNWPMLTKPYHIPKTKINCSLFAIFNICTIIATITSDLSLPCKERVTVARHTHIMAGCSPALYWLVTFIYHMTGYVLCCCCATLIAAAFFDHDQTLDNKVTLVAVFTVLVLSGMNNYAFMYFLTFCFNERNASLVVVAFLIVFGFLIPILIMGLEDLKTGSEETVLASIMDKVGLFIPVFMFTKSLIQVTDTARFNSFCSNNIDKCPNLPYYTEGFDAELCCSQGTALEGPFSHFALNKFAAGKSAIIILVQFVCFSSLVLLIQYGLLNRLWNTVDKICFIKYPQKTHNCRKVKNEAIYVANHIGRDNSKNTLLVDNAWKIYREFIGRRNFAVKGVSFSVKKGECFGILGLNGAGKTTTFKLITKEESLSKGKITVKDHSPSSSQYLRCLGYCPQFSGLDYFRTGGQNLKTLLTLRGLKDDDVKREMAAWLDVVGMSKYAHRTVSGYSGGMVRRLATAASLCGSAPLTLLDEPTAGVDTAARRLVWAALRRGLRHDRSIAISSHCMDEMERLCNRVMILSFGEMSVLGTPHLLKDEYAAGHIISFKLRAECVQGSEQDRLMALKRSVEKKFSCFIKYKHLTSLQYRITEKLPYSQIFTTIEEIVEDFQDLIEDYSVSDTSLEDVFLAIAYGETKTTPISWSSKSSRGGMSIIE